MFFGLFCLFVRSYRRRIVYLRYSGAKKGNSVGIEFQILGWVGPDEMCYLNAEGLELAVDRGL